MSWLALFTIHQREMAMFAANLIRWIFLALLFCSVSASAEHVTMAKDLELREEPSLGSVAHSPVKQGAIGKILTKNSPWVRVDVNGKRGWLLTTNIRYTQDGNLQSPPRLVTTGTSTIGIRVCFDPMEVFPGDVSEKQLQLLDSYAVSAMDAARPDEPLPAIAPRRE